MSVPETPSRAVSWRRTAPYAVAAGIAGLVTLLMIPWWLHLFGPAAYGRFAVTWTISIACASACVGWVRQSAMRTAGTARTLSELPRWVVPLAVVGTGVATAAVSEALGALSGLDVLAGGAMGAASAVSQLVATVMQRDDRGWKFAVSESVRVAVTLTVTWWLGTGADLSGQRALLLGTAMAGLSGLLFVPWPALARPVRPGALGEWWSYGWPLSAWLTLAPLVLYMDRIVLQLFADADLVGSFAALSDLVVRGLAVLATPLVTSGSIWAMREFNAGREREVLREMRRLTLLATVAAFAAAGVVWLAHDWLASLVGLRDLPAACFPLLALGGGLWQASLFAHKPLELARRSRTMMVVLAGAVVVVTGLCLVLVPAYAATGAATALVAGVAAYLVATVVATVQRPAA